MPLFAAFMFGAPLALWGLLFAAAPLLIHLLNRQQFREMAWAAMPWLIAAIKKNSRRIQIEQWLLLAIRTLIIAIAIIAAAKPTLEQMGAAFFAGSSVTHIILVFDNSMSMHFGETDRNRWERAKQVCETILDDAQKGDVASVVVMGAPSTTLVNEPSPYLKQVAAEIGAIKPQHGLARIEPAIDRVNAILKNSRAARKQVILVTDLQRVAWTASEPDGAGRLSAADAATATPAPNANTADAAAETLAKKLVSVSEQAHVTILNMGAGESPNLAVTSVNQVEPIVVINRPTVIRATVANYSAGPRTDLRVELVIDGQVEAAERVTLQPGEQRNVNFSHAFAEAAAGENSGGGRVVEVRIPDDALRVDDRRFLVVNVRRSLSVLLVEGEPSGEAFRSEADYLRVALAPGGDESQAALIRVETKLESDLLETNLDDWDLVVLCNVGQLTASEIGPLTEYVRRGGGLLYFLGSQTNIPAFNQLLYNEGKGLAPVRLIDLAGANDPARESFAFDPLDYSHPVIAPFRDAERAGLLTTKVFRYVKVELSKTVPAAKVLAYQTGDPAIVVAPFGFGQVGVVTTSADLDWNSWAVSPSYVPVVQELTQQLVSGRARELGALVGEPLVAPAPRRGYDVSATMSPPESAAATDERAGALPIKIEERDGIRYLDYSETDLAGVYRARLGPPVDEVWPMAVNTWPAESDLSRLLSDDLKSLYPGWEFTLMDEWHGSKARAAVSEGGQGELFRPLLYATLLLLFLETYLAWKFGHHT